MSYALGGNMTAAGNSPSWAFSEPPDFLIAAARTVLSGEDPVYCIQHTKDGGWWFFGSPAKFPPPRTRLVQARLGEIVALHPYVTEFAGLPPGSQVERYPADSPWTRSPVKDD